MCKSPYTLQAWDNPLNSQYYNLKVYATDIVVWSSDYVLINQCPIENMHGIHAYNNRDMHVVL